MDDVISASDQQSLVSSFLEIAVGQSADTARQFLQATSWKLEDAVQLFFIGNEAGAATPSLFSRQLENYVTSPEPSLSGSKEEDRDDSLRKSDGADVHGDDVRPPLPVKRDILYDNAMLYSSQRTGGSAREARVVVPFRNFEEEMKRPGIWEAEQGSTSAVDTSRDNLASLYRPPFALIYQGPFEKAKDAARVQNKWLLVNLQSTREFSSHMLNRDTWSNEALGQTIKTNFIFWQVYDDTEEGSKVCTYYKLDSIPVVMVIDPITGQKIRSWRGMVQPENLLEDLLPFMDGSPSDHHVSLSHKRPRESRQAPPKVQEDTNKEDEELLQAIAASMEGIYNVNGVVPEEHESRVEDEDRPLQQKTVYPPLPEEPKGEKYLLCRVGFRLPDGRRLQRNFLRNDSIQLLWSFCASQLEEARTRQFRLTLPIPGASKILDYDSNSTLEESGLANSMISVTWE